MKKTYIYIALVAFAICLLVGCGQDIPEPWEGEGTIVFSPGGLQTKAMLSSSDLENNGTRLQVFDFVTGFEGSVGGVPHSKTETFQYFQDAIEYDNTKPFPWKYVSGKDYIWTKQGQHKFFGWLINDAKSNLTAANLFGESSFSSGGQLVDGKLTIPLTEMTTGSPQFDFSYSDIQTVDVESGSFNPADVVPLDLHHLFSALCITFENKSDIPVNINSIDIPAFPDKGSAVIDYSGSSVVVEYTTPYPGDFAFFNTTALASVGEIAKNEKYNVFTGRKDDESYYLIWPVERALISPTTFIEEVDEIPIYASSDSLIHVTYTSNGNTKTAKGKFPNEALEAGKKNHVNIQFTNKQLNITAEVLPWKYTEHVLNFDSDAITTPNDGKLTVDPTSCTLSSSVARMITGSNIKCSLKIQTPQGATLIVSMKGDTDYFTLSPSSMTINEGTLRFEVCPSTLPTGGAERSIQLSFVVVLPDGREIDADRELIDTNYTFVRL